MKPSTVRNWFIVAGLICFVVGAIFGIAVAKADHGGPTFEHECPLPDGDPRGWPCTHTEPDGQKFIDWSYAYIDD